MRRFQLDAYVVDVLMPDLVGHDKRPSALLVYLALWARTAAMRVRRTPISLRDLAHGTGLSKRAVQDAVRLLTRRKLVAVSKASQTSIPEYEVLRPWVRR